jgi:signal peptidase II
VARRAAGPSLSVGSPWPVRVGLLLAAIVIVLDQATKEVAEAFLERGEFVPLLGDAVGWQLVYNPGGAFGLPAPSWLFIIVTVAVTVIVGRTLPHTRSLLQASAYGLLLAGALGNAIDRVVRPSTTGRDSVFDGEVVDFIAWGTFPRFNVADSAITVGFVLLVLALWQEERRAADPGGRAAEPDAQAADAPVDPAEPADPAEPEDPAGSVDAEAAGPSASEDRP